jgi:hypothetical protein
MKVLYLIYGEKLIYKDKVIEQNNQFNKAFTRYKPTLTRAKFTGEGGSAVESNVFQQDE